MGPINRLIFFVISVLFTLNAFTASGEVEITGSEKQEIIQHLQEADEEWERVSLSGKLKMDGLPLTPSIKIFMLKDSVVEISVRAPLFGEVGRCEITADTLLIVNKMKKIYCCESLENWLKNYPAEIGELQNLLLARLALPGTEKEKWNDEGILEIYKRDAEEIEHDPEYALIPGEDVLLEGVGYGYLLNHEFMPKLLLVVADDIPDLTVTLDYTYQKKGYNIIATFKDGSQVLSAVLELDNPEYGKGNFDKMKLGNKYTRVSIERFLKSF